MRKRLCLFEVCLFSMLVPFIVRFFSFDRALKMVEPGRRWRGCGLPTPEEVAAFVDRTLGYRLLMRRQLCLRRSLVLYRFLKKLGLNVQINFGVVPPGRSRRLKAHSWLSLNGKPYLEKSDAHMEFELIHSHGSK